MGGGKERLLHVAGAAQPVRLRPGAGVALLGLVGELGHGDAADRRPGAGEVAVHQALLEPDRLEDLRGVVRADRRDAHLGEHLEEAGPERFQDPLARDLGRDVGDLAPRREVGGRVEHEVGVHDRGAVADQRRDVVDLARLARLDREAGVDAVACAHQVLVDGRGGEERRDRRVLLAHGAVAQDEDRRALADRLRGVVAEAVERALHRAVAVGDPEGHVEDARLELAPVELAQDRHLRVLEDRAVEQELHRRIGAAPRAGSTRGRGRCEGSSRCARGPSRSPGS